MKYYSLTTPQQNIWNLHKYYENTSICNIAGMITLKNGSDVDMPKKINYAVNRILDDADALRLQLVIQDGIVKQYFSEYKYEEIPVLDYSGLTDYEVQQCLDEEARKHFDVIDSPLYRFLIVKQGTVFSLFMVMHHLICDGWSATLLVNKISEYMNEYQSDKKDSNELYSYVEFILEHDKYLDSRRFERDEKYWEDVLQNIDSVSYVKPNMPEDLSIEAERYVHKIMQKDSDEIAVYCNNKNISPDMLYKIAFAIYLYKINHKEHVVLGTPVFNRDGIAARQTAGMYVSTMPLCLKMDENSSVSEMIEECISASVGVFRHCKYPFEYIQSKLQSSNHGAKLFDVMVSYEDAFIKSDNIASAKWLYQGYCENTLVVHIDDRDGDNCLEIAYDYQKNSFRTAEEVELLALRIQHIIEQIISDDSEPISDISIIPEAESERLLKGFNDTYSEYPRNKCVHELFTEQVRKTPEKTAVVCDERKLTYIELEHMSNDLAAKLQLDVGEVVALNMNRSEMILVVQLAVLKSGGIFLPIDMSVPVDRMIEMLKDSGARYIVVDGESSSNVLEDFIETIDITTISLNRAASETVGAKVNPEMGAHIIYTSGSTGKPKGSILTHRGLMNFVYHNLVINPDNCKYDNSISINTISFDMFLCETITPLVSGVTVHIATERQQINQRAFSEYVKNNDIQILQTTPTRYKILTADKTNLDYLNNFKVMLLSGEPFSKDIYHEMKGHSNAKIYNTCGPSENHIWICGCELVDDDITLGAPIKNNKIYILGEKQDLLPIGVPGEVCVSGDCIGLGYLNRPELNKEKYIPHPFDDGKLLYRTGDLALFRPNGTIEPLGRIDSQVKIRGFRVELGEIESCISQNAEVAKVAAVVIRDLSKEILCVFYEAELEVDTAQLKEAIGKILPNYMIPNLFVRLDELPITSTGKVSRKTLEQYDVAQFIKNEEYKPPGNKLEEELCFAFEKMLNLDKVGCSVDFFEAGGTSIQVIELLSYLPAKYNLTARDIYNYSTPEELARYINSQGESKYQTISCLTSGNRKQVVICFPFAGSDDATFIELSKEIEIKNTDLSVYALRRANWEEIDFEIALKEISEIIQFAENVVFYSHCAGSAMAVKIYQSIMEKNKVKHMVIGANTPPRGVKLYGRFINPWSFMTNKMILASLEKSGMEITGLSDESQTALIKQFRKDTTCYFREMAKMQGGIDVPCTFITSDLDVFTKGISDVEKEWSHYLFNSVESIVLHGANHYFHKQRAGELAEIICRLMENDS